MNCRPTTDGSSVAGRLNGIQMPELKGQIQLFFL